MSKVTIRTGKVADALSLAPRLRPADALELRHSNGPDIEKTLIESVAMSLECFAGVVEGQVIALGGIVLVEGGQLGVPWLVASPEAVRHPSSLVSAGRAAVLRWGPLCRTMGNMTHAENKVHHRWLQHIGFTLQPWTVPVGDSKEPFIQFYRHSKHV